MKRNSQHISQDLRQTLRLSPAQIRFGRLLEMSQPEFEDELGRELEENPALELVDPVATSGDNEGFNETSDQLMLADYGSDDDIPSYMLRQQLQEASHSRPDFSLVDSDAYEGLSLESQINDLNISEQQRRLALYVIGNLDTNGYLTRSAMDMATDLEMSGAMIVTPEEVEDAVNIVRSLDPPGIGARDLSDCLSLQLSRMEPNDVVNAAKQIINQRFYDIATNNVERIASTLNLPVALAKEAFDLIRGLNPKPGASLETVGIADRMRQITPDFYIDTDSEGHISVSLAGRTPELQVEASFTPDNIDSVAAAFIKERRDSATQFINLTKRRAATLMAVMTAIVRRQKTYFQTFDRADLRPMVLKEISADVGVDVSTVSRAVNSKYAQTPQGLLSLKSLFSESVNSDGDISTHTVAEAIKAVIDKEDPRSPVTDSEIAAALSKSGINVARRTVAKYRESLGIPSSLYRKH